MPSPLELLAPAGNATIGMAAIDHGADAVYIGAPRFSARAAAGNTVDEIAALIQYAHVYYARVYVALNTILTDSEIPDALDLINQIHRIGADGLIIQDMGLLELDLPPIPLIASTQMHNNTPAKVKFLEAAGFSRVILARELSLDEIAEIRGRTRVDIECFVHGALCVSYSGQCYLSHAVAQRSGNRGMCAQPCRSRYTLMDGAGKTIARDKYMLSLKDLNFSDVIPSLVAAGVTSFKIEGRYKDIGYVKNITACYRRAIDSFIANHPEYRRGSSGSVDFNFTPGPDKTFNRGYTRYFISGRKEKTGSMDTQKSMGKFVGTVTTVEADFFRMKGERLQNGDGICFYTAEKKLAGFRVNKVVNDRIHPSAMHGLRVGAGLFRNHDHALGLVLKKKSAVRRIGLAMRFSQDNDHIRLELKDEDGNHAVASLESSFQAAQKKSGIHDQIRDRLARVGNTPYQVTEIEIHPEMPGFIPPSAVNRLRREAMEKLDRIRRDAYSRKEAPVVRVSVPYPEKKLDFRANVLNAYARGFYERHGAEVNEPAFETLSDPSGKTVMTARHCIRYELDACPLHSQPCCKLEEPLKLKNAHHMYRLEFDCKQCEMLVIFEK